MINNQQVQQQGQQQQQQGKTTMQCEYSKQVWQGARDVILSTKTMMLLVNEGSGNIETFSNASSQVAVDTKQLIVLMFNAESPVFSQLFLFEATKALKTYILNLIKASKDCVLNPSDAELRSTLDIWCRRVGEVLKEIMVVVQPILPPPPANMTNVMGHSSTSLPSLSSSNSSSIPNSSHTNISTNISSNNISNSTHSNANNTNSINLNNINLNNINLNNINLNNINLNISNINNTHTNNTTNPTMTDTEDMTNESESDKTATAIDDDNEDPMTADFEDEEGEFDFVVSALSVYSSLEDLRSSLKESSDKFAEASQVVLSSTASLLDASQNMSLIQSAPRLRAALESLVVQLRQVHSGSLSSDAIMSKLESYVCELEEAVGECVDEFRNSSNPYDISTSPNSQLELVDMRDTTTPTPPSPRRKPLPRDDSFREAADRKTVFGMPLDLVLKHQKGQYPSLQVPVFFRDALTYLRREGLDCVGIFKATIPPEKLNSLVHKINGGHKLDFGGECDPYAAANLIKKYLASLPFPLCSGKSKTLGGGTGLQEVQAIVQSMPAANQHLLCELCALLHQLSLHSQANQMPAEALATAIGPYLFFSAPNLAAFPWHAHTVVCIMIERFQEVFKQYPSRSDYPMARSASDITPKSTVPPAISSAAATFSTPQLRPRTAPSFPKKKNYLPRLPRGGPRRMPTPPYKICVVGETGVGKTALVHRMLRDEFIDYHEPTVEEKFEKTLVLEGDVYSVEMLDTSGSHIDNLAYQKWFEWAEGFIVMIDITSAISFEKVQYWLDEISRVRPTSYPFMLVGSHMDGELNRACPRDVVESYLRPFGATYVEYSAKFPAPNIHRILTIIITEIQNWRKKNDLEKLKSPKKSTKRQVSKPKRNESDSHLMVLDSESSPQAASTHKGFLLKWKERRRPKPAARTLIDNWTSKVPNFEAWMEVSFLQQTAQEKDLAQLALPSPNGSKAAHVRPLINMDCLSQGYNVELSRDSITTLYPEPSLESVVEPVIRYYQSHFVGREHANYVGDEPDGKVIVSFLLSPGANGEDSDCSKVIVRTKKEDHRVLIPYASRKDMLKSISKALPSLQVSKWQEVKDPSFVDSLVNFEGSMGLQTKHKFGILLCKEGQHDENDMFGNKDSTPELEAFMSMLGQKITLQGWNKFRGGLDVKTNSTGTFSYFTEFQGTEIMFHVSTLLPYQDDDIQRVERKRHIGNDIVTVIFKSGNEPFSPNSLKTNFTHIFCVVSVENYEAGKPNYRIAIANKHDIRPYPPFVPNGPNGGSNAVFASGSAFREFLLSKLINGERAALRSDEFSKKLTRTRKAVLLELADKCNK